MAIPLLAEKEAMLVEKYSLIEDRHERLNAILQQSLPHYQIPKIEQLDVDLVKGCVSRVWLKVASTDGLLEIRFAADSALVGGLAGLLVELYSGAKTKDAVNFKTTILEKLALDRMLSPTRLHGLQKIIGKIQEDAKKASTSEVTAKKNS